jgi:hypothetical protein
MTQIEFRDKELNGSFLFGRLNGSLPIIKPEKDSLAIWPIPGRKKSDIKTRKIRPIVFPF